MILKNPKNSLHLINNLLAVISKSNAELFQEIKTAIEFSDVPLISPSITVLHKILSIYSQSDSLVGFHHWNMFFTKELDPLWLRPHFLKILQVLQPYDNALLIIANLQAALSPPHPHAMNAADTMEYLESLAATEADPAQTLNLLFL